jgi:phenylpropionate dioxygenase-like ring-hydroxylating dioxygenase large terminal subunit
MTGKTTETLGPGEARCPGLSTRDIVMADAAAPPSAFMADHYAYLGSGDVSYDAYLSPEYAAREEERMWPEVWQMACRLEQIPKPKDFIVYDIADTSILVVRQNDGGVKAFINSCRHRGMQLAKSETRGHAPVIRCPFHGWTWDAKGDLMAIPCSWDFPHVDKAAFGLDAVHVDVWGGFVFVCLAETPPPLRAYLEVIPDLDLPLPMERRHIAYHVQKVLPANWKIASEAFLEAYHVLATHPEGLAFAGDANCQYDVYGKNVSRFLHTIGFRSPHLVGEGNEAEILQGIGGGAAGLSLQPGERARDVWAKHLRGAMGQQLGVDLSAVSTTQMMDSIEYFCFPNFFFFPGLTFPMVYRFRPVSGKVDEAIFDLYFLKPTPEGQDAPAAPETVYLGAEERFVDAPGMDARLGYIYDQDVENLRQQTRGIRSSRKPGQTLGNYQEIRIRRMRETLSGYVG